MSSLIGGSSTPASNDLKPRQSRGSFEAERVATQTSERVARDRKKPGRGALGRSKPSNADKSAGWGKKAKKGWLSDKSLSLSPKDVPRGFTVNTKDEKVMLGLRLFPCELFIEERSGHSTQTRSTEAYDAVMNQRFIGLSNHYFIVLSPMAKKKDHCEVEMMRSIEEVVRISFRKSRPQYVTFELAPRMTNPRGSAFLDELGGELRHLIFCSMTEGLQDCVGLIKEYLNAKGL